MVSTLEHVLRRCTRRGGTMSSIRCAARLEVTALPDVPIVQPGDDLAGIVRDALARSDIALRDGDVVVVASKIVSRAEARFVDLATVTPSARAEDLAREIA